MKKEVFVGAYFIIYVALPAMILHYIQIKYPEIANSNAPLYTMLFLIIIFISSVAGLYIKHSSVSVAISVVATIVYMNTVLSQMHLQIMGANITIDLRTTLYAIYALLIVKILIALYEDLKQKDLSSSTDKGVQ